MQKFNANNLQMQWWLTTLLCWPVLLWQGRRVRKLALRLPEANGARSGVHGVGKPLRLLICGDSAAAGVGIAQQQDAISGQLIALLAKQYQVEWQLQAKTGLDSAALVPLLQKLPVQQLDLVVISVGVNDVTALCSPRRFCHQLRQALRCIQQRYADPKVILSTIPPMQHFTMLPLPLNHWLGVKAAILNAALQQELVHWPRVKLVLSPAQLQAQLFAADGFHPSVQGCAVWAKLLAGAITEQDWPARSERHFAFTDTEQTNG